MTDIIIVSFSDSDLNEYFEKSRLYLEEFISSAAIAVNVHGVHNSLTKAGLEIIIQKFEDKYAIVIFAHGTENSVLDSQGGNIVLHEDQAKDLNKAIVYSTACYNASSLGFKMSHYGCKLFFGFSGKSYVTDIDDYITNTFIQTDNYAFIQILSGEEDCKSLSGNTETFFKHKYDEIKDSYPESAVLLMHNKEAVRFYENNREC